MVHGAGGLDEASLEGPNEIRLLEEDNVTISTIDAQDIGLSSAPINSLKGGDLSVNKKILVSVLKGEGTEAQRDVVALNTSLVLWAAGLEEDIGSGVTTALNCLKEGLPWKRLEQLKRALEMQN